MTNAANRIGIFGGTFDPIHSGHVSFALQAAKVAGLGQVCFVPERLPYGRDGAEHFGHRVAMIRQAIRPYNNLALVELVDRYFTAEKTLPRLRQLFPDARLALLWGADEFRELPFIQGSGQLIEHCEFVVSVRSHDELHHILRTMQAVSIPTRAVTIVDSLYPEVYSSILRKAIRFNVPVRGLLPSVRRYASREWLYARLS